MTNLNLFESVFKAADKPTFAFEALSFEQVLMVTDLAGAEALRERVRGSLACLDHGKTAWTPLEGADFRDVESLLAGLEPGARVQNRREAAAPRFSRYCWW